MNHNRITKDLVMQVAIYLNISSYELFIQALRWFDVESPTATLEVDYRQYTQMGCVPKYVFEFCELVIEGMT